jgi:hypothetical protein
MSLPRSTPAGLKSIDAHWLNR